MVLRSKRDYLETIRTRYQRASKNAKTLILDEFCATCGYNRKYAIRLLSPARKKASARSGRRPGPKTIYREEKLAEALKRIWFASDQMLLQEAESCHPSVAPLLRRRIRALGGSNESKACARKLCNDRSVAQAFQGSP